MKRIRSLHNAAENVLFQCEVKKNRLKPDPIENAHTH